MNNVSPRMRAHLARIGKLASTPEARKKISLFRTKPPRTSVPVLKTIFAAIDASTMSHREVAKRAGLTNVALSRWRKGENTPNVADVEAVANVLNLTITVVPRDSL